MFVVAFAFIPDPTGIKTDVFFKISKDIALFTLLSPLGGLAPLECAAKDSGIWQPT